jgi:serine/threonine protein kinase
VYREKNTKYKNKKEGINEEITVYKKLNSLENLYFAKLYTYGKNYIIIDRIEGITLYEYLKKGIYISYNLIKEVDKAIIQLKNLKLSSHDIHFKNIMVTKKQVVIIDVSDFLNFEYCPLWNDSKKFYKVYNKLPTFPVPEIILKLSKSIYKFIYNLNKLNRC